MIISSDFLSSDSETNPDSSRFFLGRGSNFITVLLWSFQVNYSQNIANREHRNLWGVAKGWLIRILKLDFATVTEWIELGRVQQIRLEIQECERRTSEQYY